MQREPASAMTVIIPLLEHSFRRCSGAARLVSPPLFVLPVLSWTALAPDREVDSDPGRGSRTEGLRLHFFLSFPAPSCDPTIQLSQEGNPRHLAVKGGKAGMDRH